MSNDSLQTTNPVSGFGGFAASPQMQALYLARLHNPYAFLQQDQLAMYALQDTGLARGGNVRWRRFDDGGDTGGNDGGNDGTGGFGGAGNDGGFGNDSGGFGGGGGLGGFGGADSGFGAGDATGNAAGFGGPASDDSATSGVFDAPGVNIGSVMGMTAGMTSAGQPSALGMPAMAQAMPEPLSLSQVAAATAKGAMGPVGMANSMLGNPLGLEALGPGAKAGSAVGSAVGSMVGGPLGGMIGSGLGAVAGAHGSSGVGMGGTGSNAGTGGAADDVSDNIRRIRAALNQSNVDGYARGGQVQGQQRSGNHNFHGGSGLIHGTSDGRADALRTHVPAGGYVVPADVVSSLGQGNTMAGAKRLKGMMPKARGFAAGGSVPVRLSAGEFFIHPAHVTALGGGNRQAGSDKLDEMVGHVRRINQAAVSGMPAPR